jgi:ureidoacrylate peracid hydrolase
VADRYSVHFAIRPEKTGVIVFDMINDFLLPGSPFESPRARDDLVPRLKPLLAASRSTGATVVYTGQSNRADGSDLGLLAEIFPPLRELRACIAGTPGADTYSEIAPEPGDLVVPKRRFDAFVGTDLEMVLRQRAIDTLVITGTSTSIGTVTTARAAVARDFRVIFPSDGTVNRDLADAGWGPVSQDELLKAELTSLSQFCRVATLDEIIRELHSTR